MSYEIYDEIEKELMPKLGNIIENNDKLKKSQGFKEIIEWYHMAEKAKDTLLDNQPLEEKDMIDLALEVKNGRDSFLSKLADIIVKKMVDHVKIPFVEMTLDNIRIQTQSDKPSVKFDSSFKLDPLKPYIEFTLKINEVKTPSMVKMEFQIDSEITISDTEVSSDRNELLINLGTLVADLTISFTELDIGPVKIKKQIQLDKVNFKTNLRGYHFSKLHSVKCQNCNSVNAAEDKNCRNCEHDLV